MLFYPSGQLPIRSELVFFTVDFGLASEIYFAAHVRVPLRFRFVP